MDSQNGIRDRVDHVVVTRKGFCIFLDLVKVITQSEQGGQDIRLGDDPNQLFRFFTGDDPDTMHAVFNHALHERFK